jgi:hypothetical protein
MPYPAQLISGPNTCINVPSSQTFRSYLHNCTRHMEKCTAMEYTRKSGRIYLKTAVVSGV